MRTHPDDSKDAYLNTVARIEPDVAMLDRDGALASIAISLKRIADAAEQWLGREMRDHAECKNERAAWADEKKANDQ